MDKMIFDDNKLRVLMAEHRETNHTLSEKINVSPAYVSDYKNGKRQPSLKAINRMLECFDIIDFNELFKK